MEEASRKEVRMKEVKIREAGREKADLRKELKKQLKAVPEEKKKEWDGMLLRRILSLPQMEQAAWVYGYMALSWEAGTRELLLTLLERGKRVALPRVLGEEMDFFEIRSFSELSEGAYHILEPGMECPRASSSDALLLVPGMAFTSKGDRLGKGGGYYDKFLTKEPEHMTVALAYDFQLMERLPAEIHDKTVDMVVTPGGSYSRK